MRAGAGCNAAHIRGPVADVNKATGFVLRAPLEAAAPGSWPCLPNSEAREKTPDTAGHNEQLRTKKIDPAIEKSGEADLGRAGAGNVRHPA